jgi:hypothetical protein
MQATCSVPGAGGVSCRSGRVAMAPRPYRANKLLAFVKMVFISLSLFIGSGGIFSS